MTRRDRAERYRRVCTRESHRQLVMVLKKETREAEKSVRKRRRTALDPDLLPQPFPPHRLLLSTQTLHLLPTHRPRPLHFFRSPSPSLPLLHRPLLHAPDIRARHTPHQPLPNQHPKVARQARTAKDVTAALEGYAACAGDGGEAEGTGVGAECED